MFDLNQLPKKLYDVCDFRPCEDGGCILYNYNVKPEDREAYIIVRLADFEIPHAFKVNSKAIEATIKLSDPTLEITLNEKEYIAKSTKGKYKVSFLGIENFAPINLQNTHELNITLNYLNKACEYVAVKSNRPVLRGVHIDSNGNVVASDSYRVYCHRVGELASSGVTLPTEFIKAIKTLANDEETITIKYNDRQATASVGNVEIVSALYEGEFPNLQKVVDKVLDSETKTINRNALNEALDYARFIINDNKDLDNNVIFKNNKLRLLGQSEFETDFSIGLDGEDYLCLNVSNLISGIKSFENETIDCNFTGNENCKTLVSFRYGTEIVILMGIRKD